ncbi:MBL fold metallo-hydrolase [Telmatospirillum sp.]|uniref:MBL fold metallo-hydrolase n=1 Tax=Telmatospirillum sp. TaxID=2079197 RepID=UPI002841EADB|nr:MBL fold metallo-hydrolase [Telmatospirillum sp.]MDR3435454.1 MBL fold metallo-hydrolase [Telmatospirillum sp.]
MKITILGSGAAGGVPMISAGWGRCDPSQPRNRRRRPSILVEAGGQAVLVDTSPDLREQLLDADVRRLDAVLFTHAHADHLHGIDDLREVNRAMGGPIDAYASAVTLDEIRARFGYVLEPLPKNSPIYKPWLIPHELTGPFQLGSMEIVPFDQDHGYCRTTGFRFGPMAYSTDVVNLPDASMALLGGLDLWIVGCLTDTPHATHAHLEKVLAWVEQLQPKRTLITHMMPKLDYDVLCATLPPGVAPAYDGLTIDL